MREKFVKWYNQLEELVYLKMFMLALELLKESELFVKNKCVNYLGFPDDSISL